MILFIVYCRTCSSLNNFVIVYLGIQYITYMFDIFSLKENKIIIQLYRSSHRSAFIRLFPVTLPACLL